jgi:TonB-linked SusC/RagA family outer membrane protein
MMRFTPTRRVSFGAWVFVLLIGFAGSAWAQTATITGRVSSESGNLIEVANVYITEMNISVPTNAQGGYTITIPAERVRGQTVMLRVRAIGFTSQAKQITISAGQQSHDFAMRRDINRLQEVVITGTTGATEIKKTAFSITSVDQASMPVPSTNALQQLQGKVPGMQMVQPSGQPGSAPAIIMRGPKMLNADGRTQGPLFIVDGVIITGGSQDLNPQDIESVEVVKGAAASSLYGSRANAGVIQITTKSGKNQSAGVRFNARSEYGFSDVQGAYPFAQRHFVMMDETGKRFCIQVTGQPACSRTVDFEEEAFRVNDQGGDFALAPRSFIRDYGIGASAPKPELKALFQINHWPKRYDPIAQTITNGQFLNSNVDMTGRFGNTSYFTSASNLMEEGSVRYLDGYRRTGGRVNVDQQIGEDWNVFVSSFYSRSTTFGPGEWFRLTRVPAGVNLLRTDSKGRIFIRSNPLQQGSQNQNPLYNNSNQLNQTRADRFLGSVTSKYTPFNWLDLDANLSMDRRRSNFFFQQDRGYRTTNSSPTNLGFIRSDNGAEAAYNMGLNATARHNFSDDLAARFNARYTYERDDGYSDREEGAALALPGLRTLGSATTSFFINSGQESVRAVGASFGTNLEYKERYILDALYRYDGSSLFGSEERWHGYYRGSVAYRISEEEFWPWHEALNDFKFRASLGTAGGRPRFSAQYETFSLGSGGLVSAQNLGNKKLKPEYTTETEYGIDAELFSKYGVSVTHARAITDDQIILVPPPVASGFANQWKNAGTLDGKTWEVALNIPILTRRDMVWSSRVGWDQTSTFITKLGVPAFFQSQSSYNFRFAVGEKLGNIYGKRFVTSCAELPADFQSRCGPGKDWQHNDEGYVVWIGQGNSPADGVRKNLWQAVLPGCVNGTTGAAISATGEVDCRKAGGTVNAPWGQAEVHWGMLTNIRDSTGAATLNKLGNTLPDWRLTLAQTFQWKKLQLYALVDHSHGNELMNEEIHWSLGDFMVRFEDQDGKTVENAKPIGYYWRATRPESGAGVGGFYDVLGANNKTVQSGQYTKLREVNVAYSLGKIRGIIGDWNVSLVGRNLYTFTDFMGWDPEVGTSGGNLNSSAIGNVASYQYPPRRTFTFSLGSRF